MEEEIFTSILSEELDILRSLKNRLFDLPYEMYEEDKRGGIDHTRSAETIGCV